MADGTTPELFDFEVAGRVRVIIFEKILPVAQGVTADVYGFADDKTHELRIYTVDKGVTTPADTVAREHRLLEGYVKGKGTLAVESANGAMETYYFEKEHNYKEVTVSPGQTVRWTAPNDSTLVYYEMRERNSPPPPPEPKPELSSKTAKLLLTSVAISDTQAAELAKLVGKPPTQIKLALIENAADVEAEPKAWLVRNREMILSHGFDVEIIDLNKYRRDSIGLMQTLRTKQVIWISGGNTFYIRWLLEATRADAIIKSLVSQGVVYGGGSAGAVLAGPTLKYFEAADDPSKAPEVHIDGLNLIDQVVVPHADNAAFAQAVQAIDRSLHLAGYKTVLLKDTQALVVNGDQQQVV